MLIVTSMCTEYITMKFDKVKEAFSPIVGQLRDDDARRLWETLHPILIVIP